MTGHHFKRFLCQKVFRQVKITNRKINQHCTLTGLRPPSNPPGQVESHLSVLSRSVQKTSFSLPSLQTLSLPEQMFLQHFLSKLTVGKNHEIHHKKEEQFNNLIKSHLVAVTSHSTQPRWPCWGRKRYFRRQYKQLKQSYITSSASA